ncbi:MAG: T9SS type A sorting domain-containing protein [Lewinellaceae bacterium]|nr:T9SS type A sorting domain-containing protein [Lewinellaceae bacterium]
MIKNLLLALLFCLATVAQAQYSETFSIANRGYLINSVNDFTGVDWTLSAWGAGRGATDYFQTTAGGVLEATNLDEEVCWVSPQMTVLSTGNISFTADISWDGFDVNQQINGGAWVRHPNVLGGNGDPAYTVSYTSGTGPFTSSASTNFAAIAVTAGNTFKVRMCARVNGNTEFLTLDNVNISGVSTGGCIAPTLGTSIAQAGSCNSANGAITVTATGATPGYNVAWSGPSSGNPGGTEIAGSGGMYTITALNAGTYTITVTDAASCTATTTTSVTVATAMSLGTQVLNTTCSSVSDGEINLSVSNGVPPYSYSWSNLPGSPDPQDQAGLSTGTYTVTVTDNAGCTASTSATVSVAAPVAYLETFSIANRGYLPNFVDDFAGVNWTLSNWPPDPFGRADVDYFRTSGGALTGIDLDQEVCWTSPVIDIDPPGTGIAFSVDLAWVGFDDLDYINVQYSVNGNPYITVDNVAGGETATVEYPAGSNNISGSTTVTVTGIMGSTLQIQVCADVNASPETISIDNVSVPGSNSLHCPCPTITFTGTPTNTCSGASNGQIAVTGVTGGTGPYMYSKDNGVNYQSGATFTGLAAGMYDVVVKDADGCVSAPMQVTVGTFTAPACTVSGSDFVCSNSENNVYNAPGGMSDYSWSISGDGSIPGSTTDASVSVTAGNFLNSYTVSVVVTDANGCTSSCSKESFIYLAQPPANITVSPDPVCVGAMLDLSISAAASSTVSWSGEGITNPSGNPSTTAFPTTPGSQMYSVMVTTNPAGCTNTGTVNVTVEDCEIDFSGKIIWEDDGVSGVKDATVNLTGSVAGSDLTDVTGSFLIMTGLTSGNFTLKPVKNINKFNGVTAGDATAIQQHVTFINVITDPYKQVCADVNKNNSINTLDASLIVQSLLGNPAANALFNTSWRFVPSSYVLSVPPWGFPEQRTYTGISGPQTDQDFIGMKIGDVTGDANPANFGSGQPLVLRVADQVLKSGETIDVVFRADQLDDLAAFQFGLHFDPAQLQFVEIQPEMLPITADNFGLYNVTAGEILAVWAQATGLAVSEATPVFRLRFTPLQSGLKLSEVLKLDDNVLPGLNYTAALDETAVELHFDAATGTTDPAAAVLGMQVWPNPFRDETTVSFNLPEAGVAQLRVLDISGRELLRINKAYPAGISNETLHLQELAGTGVLLCELTTSIGVVTQKLVAVGN